MTYTSRLNEKGRNKVNKTVFSNQIFYKSRKNDINNHLTGQVINAPSNRGFDSRYIDFVGLSLPSGSSREDNRALVGEIANRAKKFDVQ